jgi:hypothetical protein
LSTSGIMRPWMILPTITRALLAHPILPGWPS